MISFLYKYVSGPLACEKYHKTINDSKKRNDIDILLLLNKQFPYSSIKIILILIIILNSVDFRVMMLFYIVIR